MKDTTKKLADLIYKAGITETAGSTHADISNVVCDSRKTTEGSLFVAIKGYTVDGHQYVDQAISSGARAVVCEVLPEKLIEGITYVRVNDTRKALGAIAANYYDDPSGKLQLIGVTGTNGKTTIVRMLYEVFTRMGHPCGMLSTISNIIADQQVGSDLTTPDVLTTNQYLSQMVSAGCRYAFMEVSSHALVQGRTEGIRFAGAVFTNLSHDHLDYHKSFKEYLKSKQKLFNTLDDKAFALTNLDDKNGIIMVQNTRADKKTYSLKAMADYKGKIMENRFSGMHMVIDKKDVWCKLTGTFNAYNVLAVYATGCMLGAGPDDLLTRISSCKSPEGRFDLMIGKNNVIGIVDYAHTPDALENVLQNIREVRTGNERLITVVGCGGNRDKGKRGTMAAIAASYSDKVIFTSDNPRYEEPEAIIEDMKNGLEINPALKSKHISIVRRDEAINVACVMATDGDIILVAGKGHEKYQEIKGVKHPFDDKATLQKLLNR